MHKNTLKIEFASFAKLHNEMLGFCLYDMFRFEHRMLWAEASSKYKSLGTWLCLKI